MIDNLSLAIEIAARAHQNNFDDAGIPSILHAISVMGRVNDTQLKIIAVLHDVIEDSDTTLKELSKYFSDDVIAALDALTRRNNESYDDYILRVKNNPLATEVKIADLEHNMDILRLPELSSYKLKRIKKYHKVWFYLKGY